MLRAFSEDNPNNLDVPGEMDKFLAGLTHCVVLRSTCWDDRRSNDKVHEQKYTQGQIVTTLTTLLQFHTLSPFAQACFASARLFAHGQVFLLQPPTTSFCPRHSCGLQRWDIF